MSQGHTGAVAIAGAEEEARYELTEEETTEAEKWFAQFSESELQRLKLDETRAQDAEDYDDLAQAVEKELSKGRSSLQMFMRVMNPVKEDAQALAPPTSPVEGFD